MSREDSAAPSTTPSHTSTNQWQSFEVRMRLRRAERCVLRAEVALEAGRPEEAREALDEARRLDSSRDYDALEALIAERLNPPVRRTAPRARAAVLVTAALASAIALLLAWSNTPDAPTATGPAATLPITNSTAATPVVTDPPVSSPAPAAAAIVETEFVRPEVESAPERQAPRATAAAALTQARLGDTSVSPASLSQPLPVSELPPERTVPSTPEPKEPASSRLDPVVEPIAVPMAPTPPPITDAPAADERPRVRAALGRYEAGYSSLNVDGVRAVWPGVDARSLARAFEGLASQSVSLGQCSISVAASTARADCRGQATWAPRIGGGRQTADRTWTFDLRNVAGAWQIVRVQAR